MSYFSLCPLMYSTWKVGQTVEGNTSLARWIPVLHLTRSLCCVLGRDTLISHCSLAYQVTGEPSTKPSKILRVKVTLGRTGFPSREGKGRNSPGRLMTWATRTPRWTSDWTQLTNRLGAGEKQLDEERGGGITVRHICVPQMWYNIASDE